MTGSIFTLLDLAGLIHFDEYDLLQMQLRDTDCVLLNRRLPLQTIMPKVQSTDEELRCRKLTNQASHDSCICTIASIALLDFACFFAGSSFDGCLRGMLFLATGLVVGPLLFCRFMEVREAKKLD